MPTDTQSILDSAAKIGDLVKDHPAFERYRSAAKSVSEDPEAGRLVNDFNRQLETLLRQEQSGMPVTVTQATNNNAFAGFALQRPNLIANPNLTSGQRTPAHFFNTSSFATAPQFVIGNASRNPVRGPAYRDLDIALIKHTTLPGETDMEFRGEVFNITNTPAFAQPNGSFGSPAFGSITATTTDPRVIQFAIRLSK